MCLYPASSAQRTASTQDFPSGTCQTPSANLGIRFPSLSKSPLPSVMTVGPRRHQVPRSCPRARCDSVKPLDKSAQHMTACTCTVLWSPSARDSNLNLRHDLRVDPSYKIENPR